MRFPLSYHQALILVKLINDEKLKRHDMVPMDLITLTQVGAIRITKEQNNNQGLTITAAGKRRFVKWARKEGMIQ